MPRHFPTIERAEAGYTVQFVHGLGGARDTLPF